MKIQNALFFSAALFLSSVSAYADSGIKGRRPKADTPYYLYNVSKGQYLSWDAAQKRFSLSGKAKTQVMLSQDEAATGSYRFTVDGAELATTFQENFMMGNDLATCRQWLLNEKIDAAEGDTVYALGCRDVSAGAVAYLYWSDLVDGIGKSYVEHTFGGQWRFVSEEDIVQTLTLDEKATAYATPDERVHVNLIRKLVPNYWNTVCLPFSLTEGQLKEWLGEGTVALEYVSCEDNTLHFVSVKGMEAGVPYLVQVGDETKLVDADKGEYYTFKDVDAARFVENPKPATPAGADYTFYASFVQTTAPSRVYVLNNDQVYHLTSSMTMKGFRGYFRQNTPSAAPLNFWTIDEDVTDISTVFRQRGRVDIYNTKGQLVRRQATSAQGLVRGIYVVDDQKVLVR